MPLEGKVYHYTELLPGKHPMFRSHSAKMPVLETVRKELANANMPASAVSVVRLPRRNNLSLRVCLKNTPPGIEELPTAVEAIERALNAHGIGHVHNGWSTFKRRGA
jgi:hypothetical protein